jgi:hypothetical protein
VENVNIRSDDLSTVATGQIGQNALHDLFFAERVKSDAAQHDRIPWR